MDPPKNLRLSFFLIKMGKGRKISENFSEEEGPPLYAGELRNLAILRQMPYVVPFEDRVRIFQELISLDKSAIGRTAMDAWDPFQRGIHVHVRRNYLYEDSLEKMSPTNGTKKFCHFLLFWLL